MLVSQGLKVSTVKHAHHEFDVDIPGKDSYEHRQAGAGEVIVSSSRRWALVHEIGHAPEPVLSDLLRLLSPCDLVLVEGFKTEGHSKLEVHRAEVGKPPLHPRDPHIVAIASHVRFPDSGLPWADLNDIAAIADLVLKHAEPLDAVLARLQTGYDGTAI